MALTPLTPVQKEYANLLYDGNWQEAITLAVNSGMTAEQIGDLNFTLNFYPSVEFGKYKQNRLAYRNYCESVVKNLGKGSRPTDFDRWLELKEVEKSVVKKLNNLF
jgi:hypothetical protein